MEGKTTEKNKQQNNAVAPQDGQSGQAEQSKPTLPIEFEAKVYSIMAKGIIKANASVNVNGAIAIRGVKVIEGSNGLFVSMPSYKSGDSFKDICFPITTECREKLTKAVLEAYEQAVTQSQGSVEKHHAMRQAPEGQALNTTGM